MCLITVVVPLYNKEKHIERSLASILAQTVKPYEILVVDDGSTDRSAAVVEGFTDERIRLIRKENGGVSTARNRGISEARGELVAFLDSDDAWKPHFLETILGLRSQFPEAGAYGTAYETFDGKAYNPVGYMGIPGAPWEGIIPNFFQSMRGQPPLWASAVAIPRSVLDDVGGFKEGEVIAEDVELWCRIALKYPIAFSAKVRATYFLDADNRCYVRGKKHKRPTGYIDTLDRALVDPKIKEDFKQPIAVLREMVELGEATSLFFAGRKNEARQTLKDYQWIHLKKEALMWSFLTLFPPALSEWLMHIKSRLMQ